MSGAAKGSVYSQLLTVSGTGRISGQGKDRATNFVQYLGTAITRVKRISVSTCSFPNNFYNLIGYDPSYSQNNETLLGIQIGATFTMAVFKAGFYSVSQMMTAVIAAVNGVALAAGDAGTFVLTFDSISAKCFMQWTSAAANALTFYQIGRNTLTSNGLNPNMLLISNPLTKLGFPTNLASSINTTTAFLSLPGAGQSVIFPNAPSLNGLTKVYIQSGRLGLSNLVEEDGQISNKLLPIPITAPFGGLNVFDCKQDILCERIYSHPIECNTIDIQLTDRDGNEVNIQGGNVQIEFRVWFDTY